MTDKIKTKDGRYFRVAIVGRPNVGKSALFNRLLKQTVSIVHDQPGVTRDRISTVIRHEGSLFELVDTGGIGLFESVTTPAELVRFIQLQVNIAIETSDLVLMVVDGLEGVRPLDEEIAAKLRRSGKRLWLVINKIDIPKHDLRAAEFSRLGINPSLTVSAAHGRGISLLWQALLTAHKESGVGDPGGFGTGTDGEDGTGPRIAVVGRPNVGKSSLVNRLVRAERVIVGSLPGTTRDSIELSVECSGKPYRLIDTAGIRHKSCIRSNVEMYSRHWTEKSIARSDLALLMLSAMDGATRQDREIAGMILEHQKPCIIVVNKWDLNETVGSEIRESRGRIVTVHKKRRAISRSEYEKELRYRMPFLDYAPLMFVSALEGYHAIAIWQEIQKVTAAAHQGFSTGVVNRIFARSQERVQPPMVKGRRLKIYYVTQKRDATTPTFLVFVNRRQLWVESYARYLAGQLRVAYPLTGCPIVFALREREQQLGAAKAGGMDEG